MSAYTVGPKEDIKQDLRAEKVLLDIPIIDLEGFLASDQDATVEMMKAVDEACTKYGSFHIINHGVSYELVTAAHRAADSFFSLPFATKKKAPRNVGEMRGYSYAYMARFFNKMPWNEVAHVRYSPSSPNVVQHYFLQVLEDEKEIGVVCQEYCNEMNKLALKIMELLGLSLGLGRSYFRDSFEGNESILRLNKYPPSRELDQILGTGPHTDPPSLAILHQQFVGGLQVFVDEKWQNIIPRPDAFVINIGDTLMAWTNGRYRSCLHRTVVDRRAPRYTLTFFMNPEMEKVVRPPKELVDEDHPRKYPDFTWSALLDFTQKHYMADMNTMDAFSEWISSSSSA